MNKERIYHTDGTYEEREIEVVEATLEEKKALAAQFLTETDYRIVKCAEALLLNREMPYDVAELIGKRQEARDTINQ